MLYTAANIHNYPFPHSTATLKLFTLNKNVRSVDYIRGTFLCIVLCYVVLSIIM